MCVSCVKHIRDIRGETDARWKERERKTPCATHNVVVQTLWARRTAFQDGSTDVAHDGVRGVRREEEKEEKDEEEGEEETERSAWKVEERKKKRERNGERKRESSGITR